MAANKLIQQPDILNLDSLGAFMDAQNDPIASDMGNKEQEKVKAEEQVSPETVSEEVISSNAQSEVPKSVQEEEHPRKPKVARSRKGKQVNVQPVIEAGSGEWDTMLRYAEFYNDNPDENRITVVLNPEIKRALDIIRINCRQFNFGNILNAVCRTFIERNKEKIQLMQKDKGGIL